MKEAEFKKIIWRHYRRAGRRHLPWNQTRDAYKILVSEIMLQQTQVSRVLQKYPKFLKEFPDFQTLAKAPVRRVLKAWQGMGYNRRALYLKRSAELVVKEYGGRLPKEQKELSKLPGIGWNTAGSILASAHNLPTVFIETNIRRVFIHFFFPDRRSVPDLGLLFSIEKTLDRKNPREWYHALMDYGAMLGRTIENPNRRSRHYVKQARFNGSKRQVRGKVLRALTQKKRVTFDELLHASESKKRALLPILDELMREGFIEQSKSSYTLAHD